MVIALSSVERCLEQRSAMLGDRCVGKEKAPWGTEREQGADGPFRMLNVFLALELSQL